MSAQDTYDALANVLDEKTLAEMIAQKAARHLEYDDANPDVGMGMWRSTAIGYAIAEVQDDAAIWQRRVFISDSVKKLAEDRLDELRRHR